MNQTQKLLPEIAAAVALGVLIWFAIGQINPLRADIDQLTADIQTKTSIRNANKAKLEKMKKDAEQAKHAAADVAKKIYYPTEADLGNESIYFTLFNDMLDLIKQNNIKVRTIAHEYNPKDDEFISKGGKDKYFVCDLNMKLISNYRELRNFIETLYKYPFYLKFNNLSITPYKIDKRILESNFSIRLYAHTDMEPTE